MKKERGALLTIWLVLMLAGGIISAIGYLVFNSTFASLYPNAAPWMFYIYGLLALAVSVSACFLFMWKRWAFYVYCGVAILSAILNLIIGLGAFSVFLGLFGPVILYFIMKPRWSLFK